MNRFDSTNVRRGQPARRVFMSCTTAALVAGASTHAPAATLHVPSQHSTIGAALAAAGPGDQILVDAGTYSPTSGEAFPLTMATNGVQLLGAGAGLSVLDPQGTGSAIRHTAAVGGRISGFTITGGLATNGGGIHVTAGDVQIDHNLVIDNGAENRGAGIFLDRAAAPPIAPWIHHNVVWENYDSNGADEVDPHGVLHSGFAHGILEHNLIGRSDGNGLLTSTGATPSVRHNIFFQNGLVGPPPRGRGICWLSGTPPPIFHNLFFGNVIAAILWPAGGGNMSGTFANGLNGADLIYGNIDTNPLLVDPDGGAYELQPNSPAIDAGDPTLAFDPDGTIADLGPFYFDQGGGTGAPELGAVVGQIVAAPNPCTTSTAITLAIGRTARVAVDVIDVRGRLVRRVAEGTRDAGAVRVEWDARDESGMRVAAGVYLARIEVDGTARTTPIVILR